MHALRPAAEGKKKGGTRDTRWPDRVPRSRSGEAATWKGKGKRPKKRKRGEGKKCITSPVSVEKKGKETHGLESRLSKKVRREEKTKPQIRPLIHDVPVSLPFRGGGTQWKGGGKGRKAGELGYKFSVTQRVAITLAEPKRGKKAK